MNPRMEVIFGAYIGIEDGKIVSIERKPPAEAPKAIVDGTGMVAIPGLINCHTHLATASLRCFTDDLGNTEALQALLQKEAKMDSRSAKAAALLAIAECLRFGVTSVSDLYYYPTAPAEAVVIPMDTDCMAFAVETATALRAEGVKTQIYFENRKFKQKIGFADKSGIPFALIIGGDEAAAGVVSLKDMAAGTQEKLTPAEAAAKINAALAPRRRAQAIRG